MSLQIYDPEQVRKLAYWAATNYWAPVVLPMRDRVQICATAIMEAMNAGHSDKAVLLSKAQDAMKQEYRGLRAFRGQYVHTSVLKDGKYVERRGLNPRSVKYWAGGKGTSFSEKILDEIAVRQVLAGLKPQHRATLINYAWYGIRPRYPRDLQEARKAAWRLWHDWEPAPQYLWGSKTGHKTRSVT